MKMNLKITAALVALAMFCVFPAFAGLNVSRGATAADPDPVTDVNTVPDATQLPEGSLVVREAEIDNFEDRSKIIQKGEHSMVLLDPTPMTAKQALESRENIATIEENASVKALERSQGTAVSKEAQAETRKNMANALKNAETAEEKGNLEAAAFWMDQYHKLASHLPSTDEEAANGFDISSLFGNMYVNIGVIIAILAVIALWLMTRNSDDANVQSKKKRPRGSRGSGKGKQGQDQDKNQDQEKKGQDQEAATTATPATPPPA
jgi:hypothetical protein